MTTSITLGRKVNVHAVVTDKFKKKLHAELKNAWKVAKSELRDCEKKFDSLIKMLQKNGAESTSNTIKADQENEIKKLRDMIKDFENKIETINSLEIDSLFPHGSLESYVAVAPGDDLYKIMTSANIIIKDGIIQAIEDD